MHCISMKTRNLKSIVLYNMTVKAIVMPDLQKAPVTMLSQIIFNHKLHKPRNMKPKSVYDDELKDKEQRREGQEK